MPFRPKPRRRKKENDVTSFSLNRPFFFVWQCFWIIHNPRCFLYLSTFVNLSWIDNESSDTQNERQICFLLLLFASILGKRFRLIVDIEFDESNVIDWFLFNGISMYFTVTYFISFKWKTKKFKNEFHWNQKRTIPSNDGINNQTRRHHLINKQIFSIQQFFK